MIDIQTISIVLAACSFTIAATYYVITLRNQNKSRQLQALNNVFSRGPKNFKFVNWDMTYDEFKTKFFEPDDDASYGLFRWWDIQEELGLYVKEGLLDVRLVALFMGGTMMKAWENHRDNIYEHRKREEWPRFCGEAEYLYDKVIEYYTKHQELELPNR
jgi:hypothetical protein